MANNCKQCNDTVFKTISSDPNLIELLGKSVKKSVVLAGNNITVNEVETPDEYQFTVSYNPYVALVIQSFTDDLGLQVKGATVNSFNLSWTYNKGVQSQSLNQGLTAPNIVLGQKSYNLAVTGQNITTNTTFTLTADDDTGDGNPAKTASHSILFGNFLYYGAVTIPDTSAYDPSETDIKALANQTLATNAKGANPITYSNDAVDEYEVFAAPSGYTINNFQDSVNPNPGGFTFVKTVSITNSEGFTEDYDVYRTTFDNTAGVDGEGNPITYSII